MVKELYDIRNYPRNPGTSQPGRYNANLMGDNVAIIEQNIEDYIVFAQKLSHYLKYYNDKNEEAGNWQNFLANDVSYHLAVIVADDPKQWAAAWEELMENAEAISTNKEEENKKYYTWRFDFLYTLIERLADTFLSSKQLKQWENDLEALYTTANFNIIYDLLEKYSTASKELLVDNAGIFFYKDLTLNRRAAVITNIETNKHPLSGILTLTEPLIDNGEVIFGEPKHSKVVDQVNAASEYLDDIAQQLLRLYARVHDLAETHLRISLTNFDAHQPHIGLFYAFLQLLEEHKTDINSLLLKHLDFYYKQVLNIKPKSYQPAKAYVTFEPARNVNEFLIRTGNLLSAGKDGKGKDIFYQTLQDIVVNKAVTGEIKSFTIIKNKEGIINERKKADEPLGIFACSQTDSSDGLGKPLQPGESWDAFRVTSDKSGISDLDAAIGISFYSSLVLQAPPTENTFQLIIKFSNLSGSDNLKSFVENYGTLKILTDKKPLTPSFSVVYSGNELTIEFTIPEKTKIQKTAPHLSLLFGKKDSATIPDSFFITLKTLQTAEIVSFTIKLLNQDIPVAKAETVLGMTDLSASFPAFGGVPKSGSWFKIIEPLLKGREISNLNAEIEWASTTERSFDIKIVYQGTQQKDEKIEDAVEKSLLNIVGNTPVKFNHDYIKIILNDDLGHLTYAEEVAKATIQKNPINRKKFSITTRQYKVIRYTSNISKLKPGQDELYNRFQGAITELQNEIVEMGKSPFPDPPYTPIIKSIKLKCSIAETINSCNRYYQYPHGYNSIGDKKTIVPETPCEGELYIGFKGLAQEQSLNVLVQVEEGTADPTLPDATVTWTFLHNNEWQDFNAAQFKDGTKGLIRSGIISFVSPGYDCLTNTLLPAGQFWIKAAIRFNESKAVCKIFSINTQAVLTQFIDNGNDSTALGSNLPANSITQLFPKQSSIKKVVQPYPGFGGRLEEENKKLYIRTSERLRHKGRAVNAWDYEHIIAETFPDIYKVKVLNHAYLRVKNDEEKIVSKPGDVIILVIANTGAQSSLYKPLVSKSRLDEIKEFILQLNSPFANVKVMNPLFEEITVDTIVTFRPEIKDEGYYEKELRKDIKRFLSPWAFEGGAEPDFGGIIYRAALLDFIEELPYIDFVEKLEISHQNSVTGDIAKASSPAAVLISAPYHKVEGNLATASEKINDSTLVS